MAALDAIGWDWSVGRQKRYQDRSAAGTVYIARAWRDRPQEFIPKVARRVRDVRDIVDACGYTPDDAAMRCAEKVRRLMALRYGETVAPLGCGFERR